MKFFLILLAIISKMAFAETWHYSIYSDSKSERPYIEIENNKHIVLPIKNKNWMCKITIAEKEGDSFKRSISCINKVSADILDTTVICDRKNFLTAMGRLTLHEESTKLNSSIALLCDARK